MSGKVMLKLKQEGKKLEHQGIKIEFLGLIGEFAMYSKNRVPRTNR